MSDYGRYGDTGYASRDRRDRDWERGEQSRYGRDRDPYAFDRDDERRRTRDRGASMFGGREDRYDLREDQRIDSGRHESRRERYRSDGREESYYGPDDTHDGLPIDETSRLIASNKVEGTPVYGRDGDRLGTIYNFMVDKRSGQVEYAVMRYGGFLGMGQRYYPLPWRILSYDVREGGYRIDMSHRDMERAPSFSREDEPRFSRDYGRHVNRHYGLDY